MFARQQRRGSTAVSENDLPTINLAELMTRLISIRPVVYYVDTPMAERGMAYMRPALMLEIEGVSIVSTPGAYIVHPDDLEELRKNVGDKVQLIHLDDFDKRTQRSKVKPREARP